MTAGPRRVLVTGGTGFLGSALVAELHRHGYDVSVLARSIPTAAEGVLYRGAECPVTWYRGDLEEPGSIRAGLEAFAADGGGDLVHNAALISYARRSRAAQWRVNVAGTRVVLESAVATGVGRAVHVSSVVTLGVARPDELLDEDSPFRAPPRRVDYVETKVAAERIALEFADRIHLSVVNPAAVFGPCGRESNAVRFLREVAAGRVGPAAPPGSVSVVGVEDTAAGIRLALEGGRAGRRYVLAESVLSVHELLQLAARLLGAAAPKRRVPPALWRGLVRGAAGLDRVRHLPFAGPQALALLGSHIRASGARARRELSWTPVAFERVLADAIESLRSRGALPAPPVLPNPHRVSH